MIPMTPLDRLGWDESLELPEFDFDTLEEVLTAFALTESPKATQSRVLTSLGTRLTLAIRLEAFDRGLVPPPTLP